MPPRHLLPTLLGRTSSILLAVGCIALVPLHTARGQGSAMTRAVARFDHGDYAEARADLETIVRADPRDARALYYLGRVAEQQEKSSEAVDWLEKAIALDDNRSDYHLWLGVALGEETMRASKFRQPFLARRVKSEFERAVSLDPRSAPARMGLLQFYVFAPGIVGGGLDRAREEATAIAAFNPLQGHLAAAFIAQRAKDTVAVLREYESAIAAAPDSSIGYMSLGGAYVQMARWPEAFVAYERLLKRVPTDMGAQFQIGRTSALSGQNLDRGEQAMRFWLSHTPRDARTLTIAGAHHRLGQILEKRGRRDAARAEYEEALRINPKNDDARKSLASLT